MANIATETEYDQVEVKEGIKRHGAAAIAVVVKEYQQLKDMDTVRPLDASKLSDQQKKNALELLTLI